MREREGRGERERERKLAKCSAFFSAQSYSRTAFGLNNIDAVGRYLERTKQ